MIGDDHRDGRSRQDLSGKVSRLADFGAFVEIFPGTDGLLHISEVAEHRIKDIRDELKEGDQVLVKVLAVEGNRIRLSRKAILKEQRAKMAPQAAGSALSEEPEESAEPAVESAGAVIFEGGHEEADEGGDEPNFNRDGVTPQTRPPAPAGGDRNRRRPRRGGSGGGRRPGGSGGPR